MEERQPTVAVLAGINGAGKSSSAVPILKNTLKIPAFVNADTIARGLNAFDVESEAVNAGRIMLHHLHQLAAARKSFAFETTLAARTYANWLDSLRKQGYVSHLFYFWLDSPDLAIQRVAERVRSGGHHIPEETIRRRYSRSVGNFLELYRPVVTTWAVYDNSAGRPNLIAYSNGYFESVLDENRWERSTGVPNMVQTLPDAPAIPHERIEAEFEKEFRSLLLEHARMGRSVCEGRDGQVVWITPEEIFARYGLDANGKPAA